jgi:hypothetical protein
MTNDPSIIYILSAGHSGSTLLASIIGQHREVFNAGEIGYLGRLIAAGDRGGPICSCGAQSVFSCTFWRTVDSETRRQIGFGLADLDITVGGSKLADDMTMYRAVTRASGTSMIVDATKNYRRLRSLLNSQRTAVIPILLVADPRKIVFSMRGRVGSLKYAMRLNRLAIRMWTVFRRSRAAGIDPVTIVYEELADDPVGVAKRTFNRIGLDFDDSVLDWNCGERHDIGGNGMRFRANRIVKDERWRREMSALQRFLVAALSPIFWIVTKRLRRYERRRPG